MTGSMNSYRYECELERLGRELDMVLDERDESDRCIEDLELYISESDAVIAEILGEVPFWKRSRVRERIVSEHPLMAGVL